MLSGGCNETVEYDSVIMPNNRISKHSRRIDYDNGKPWQFEPGKTAG